MAASPLLLALVLAQQMGGGNGPLPGGGREPRATPDRPPPAPTTPELRRLEGLAARFEFARDSGNEATLRAVDDELAQVLGAAAAMPDGGFPSEGPEAEAQRVAAARLARFSELRTGRGKEALAARARLLSSLVLEARAAAEALAPRRAVQEAPAEEAPRHRKGRH